MEEISAREFRNTLRIFERELGIQNQSKCCGGVTVTQCHLLMELDKRNNITLNELADQLHLDKSTVSRTVETLVNNGLVDRTIPKNNRRTTLISLTDKGKILCNTINQGNDDYYSKVLDSIPIPIRGNFYEGFKAMAQAMEDINNSKCHCIQ